VSRFAAGLLVGSVLAALGPAMAAPAYADHDDPVAEITDDRIAESSALVQSTVDPDLAYTINDSGNETAVYVIELDTGDVVGTTTLDVDGEDTEAMAIGVDDRLYVADIGDNAASRDTVALYALDQPAPGDATVTPDVYEIRYTDGPSDAETLLVDPATGELSIVTKNLLAGSVYRLPDPLRTDRINVARPIHGVTTEGMVTDGAYLPDGSGVLLRTYIDIVVYTIPDWHELTPIDTPPQPQSESLTVRGGGASVLVGTEKLPSTIYEVPIPDDDWDRLHQGPGRDLAGPGASAEAAGSVSDSDGGGSGSDRWVLASGGAVVVLGAGWLWARRGRGRTRGRRARRG
jgi:hypothetical protein